MINRFVLLVLVSVIIGGMISLCAEKSAFAENFTKKEISDLLKAREKFVQSGKVTFLKLEYKWKDMEAYKKFADELRKHKTTTVKEFKNWFNELRNTSLFEKAEKIGHTNCTYYFDGERDRLIEDIDISKINFIIDATGDTPVRVDPKNLKEDIKKITHYEYSFDGTNVMEYKLNILSIFPKVERRYAYVKPWNLDPSLATGFGEFLISNVPGREYSLSQVKEDPNIYLLLAERNIIGNYMFDTALGGAIVYIKAVSKDERLLVERIYGAFSKVNNTIFLPHLASEATFRYNENKNLMQVTQKIYLVDSWELRPISEEELKIPEDMVECVVNHGLLDETP